MSNELMSYYGFTRTPFTRDIPVSALHPHTSHSEAVARIGWLIKERGLGVVTGDVGAGKTVATRAAIAHLDQMNHTPIYLGNPAVGAAGIYSIITTRLGGLPKFRKFDLIAQTTDLLAAEEDERRRTPVLVIDEAHMLDREQLEEIRMLTNSEMDSRSPLAIILVGQPTLRRQLKLGNYAALDQRITMRYTIPGMTVEETGSYIGHHLGLAGRKDALFSSDAIALIHQNSAGLPRAVNNIASLALTAAYFDKRNMVDESSARKAIAENNAE
jgi:type II secretory pathway predicted ATPase ExeA